MIHEVIEHTMSPNDGKCSECSVPNCTEKQLSMSIMKDYINADNENKTYNWYISLWLPLQRTAAI